MAGRGIGCRNRNLMGRESWLFFGNYTGLQNVVCNGGCDWHKPTHISLMGNTSCQESEMIRFSL
jgi:hypothetical protein